MAKHIKRSITIKACLIFWVCLFSVDQILFRHYLVHSQRKISSILIHDWSNRRGKMSAAMCGIELKVLSCWILGGIQLRMLRVYGFVIGGTLHQWKWPGLPSLCLVSKWVPEIYIYYEFMCSCVKNSYSLVKLSLGELKRRGTKTPASFLHFYVSDLRSSLI